MNPNAQNPVTFESKEEIFLLSTGGQERIVETEAFYLQSGKQALSEDVLFKCPECGGIADMKSAFECISCHKTLCRDHLKKEEIIGTKVVQKRDVQGRQMQFEYDRKQLFCADCWRSESIKRTITWIIAMIFSPLVFLREVLQEDESAVPKIETVENKPLEGNGAGTIES